MTFKEITTAIQTRKFAPVYLLSGEEAYYIDVISDMLEEVVLNELEKEFNLTILYGKDTSVKEIIDAAKRYPVMSEYQLILVKEAQMLKNIDDLDTYFSKPVSSTILVLGYKYKKFDKRKALFKNASKNGIVFESATLKDNQVPDWIIGYLQEKDYKIDRKSAHLLLESLGNELSKIVNEIEKLALNIPPKSEITSEIIEKYIGISKDYNVFELTNALNTKDILKANKIINHFALNPNENPIQKVIPILYSNFLKLLIYQAEKGGDYNELLRKMKTNFISEDFKKAASLYTVDKLARIIGYFREYDMKSKGVNVIAANDGELMKELIFKILH